MKYVWATVTYREGSLSGMIFVGAWGAFFAVLLLLSNFLVALFPIAWAWGSIWLVLIIGTAWAIISNWQQDRAWVVNWHQAQGERR